MSEQKVMALRRSRNWLLSIASLVGIVAFFIGAYALLEAVGFMSADTKTQTAGQNLRLLCLLVTGVLILVTGKRVRRRYPRTATALQAIGVTAIAVGGFFLLWALGDCGNRDCSL